MKYLQLATTVTLLAISGQSYADYNITGTAQTIQVDSQATSHVYYTAPTNGKSNRDYTAITPTISGAWRFDFSDFNNVSFSGNIYLGDYETQTNVSGLVTIDGHQSYTNANHALAGVGSYDEATNTFSFSLPSGGANSSAGSNFSSDSASCNNGKKSWLGKVCKSFAEASPDWEGVTILLEFSKDRSKFSGTVQGVDQSGSGITANTTLVNFNIDGEIKGVASAAEQ